jgi:hypothetical protein
MYFSRCGPLVWAALGAVCRASPVVYDVPLNDAGGELMVREAIARTVRTPHLEKRLSADFSMEKSWNNEVLFSGYEPPRRDLWWEESNGG